jgi:hypothetical protein
MASARSVRGNCWRCGGTVAFAIPRLATIEKVSYTCALDNGLLVVVTAREWLVVRVLRWKKMASEYTDVV